MRVIPVIDLKDGRVVHARRGQRDCYQPVQSVLCGSAEPAEVMAGFLSIHAFTVFYIADLNALAGTGEHAALIQQLLAQFPDLTFWVDAGFQTAAQCQSYPPNHLPVLGSESYNDRDLFELAAFKKPFVLSLDYADAKPLGARQLFENPALWPEWIILMTLAQVGSNQGPAIELLRSYTETYPQKNFVAAGGIRDKQDLVQLASIGVQQALVASALHSGQIGSRELTELETKKYPN